MRRKKLPDNTQYFTYYNCNPKNKVGGDCAIRAISTFLGKSWKDTVVDMTNLGIKYGYVVNDPSCISKYLNKQELVKMKEPRTLNNKKILVKEWLRMNPRANCIANVGSHHIVAIKDGKVLDIWDSSECTMHSYWMKGSDSYEHI